MDSVRVSVAGTYPSVGFIQFLVNLCSYKLLLGECPLNMSDKYPMPLSECQVSDMGTSHILKDLRNRAYYLSELLFFSSNVVVLNYESTVNRFFEGVLLALNEYVICS